ncbi:MAG: TonB-dependent receptor plug domain-containing protein [Pseudomonadota bacterium]
MRLQRFLVFLLLVSPVQALAESFEQDLAITPSRLPQRLDESPSAVTVIDREMLRASGVRSIADILRLAPGMVVGSRSPSVQPVTYLGLSDDLSRRVQVMVDGFSVYTPTTGSVWWRDLPVTVDEIERIEVVRGPNTSAYGSNAFLATIKITTLAPREAPSWASGGAIGTNGVRDAHARLAASGQMGAYMLSVAHQQDDGMRGADYRGGRSLDAVRLKGELDVSHDTDVQWQVGAARARYGFGESVENDVSASINDIFRDDNDHELLVIRHRPEGGGEWSLRLSRAAQHYLEPKAVREAWVYHADDDASAIRLEPLLLGRDFDATRYDAELERHVTLAEGVRGIWGAGLWRSEVVGERFFGTGAPQRQDSARLFGHVEWRLTPDWLLNGGAMLERSSISEAALTPRLALIHHFAPSHTLRAGWSRGTRQPLLFENQGRTAVWDAHGAPVWLAWATGARDGGLAPERSTEWSLGYLWMPGRDVRMDVRAFFLEVDNPIRVFMRPSDVEQAIWYPPEALPFEGGMSALLDMDNGSSVSIRGLEWQLDARLDKALSLHANYAFADARETLPVTSGWPDYAASVPRHTAGLLLTRNLGGGWDASLRAHYASAMRWGYVLRDGLDEQIGVGARVGYAGRWGSQRLRMDVVGENLNGTVHDFDRERGWGRAVWLRIGLESI